jgi:hypothetical protein
MSINTAVLTEITEMKWIYNALEASMPQSANVCIAVAGSS